ncbi:inositol-3-phosphate synthase [Brevibacillus composti]|uniref:Inositol-3-phosphate synthase n=1 Tax=Brevibacillus composti TaxID=2796470 RepID=A0A7T5JM12_9BACL|nr:inositol-3-phosphate synthase [Brevibacillus composti]QQE72617.1 inositol-3-phosphate synthase [Brevibacillus composti]QUO39694.1 inositol-3-phosphate synthase [Brevibacillus composti]
MPSIKAAIVGVGNCASALLQGISYYKSRSTDASGLIHPSIGGYEPGDIEIVAAFDIDDRKVGTPLHQAIFAAPNCTKVFAADVEESTVVVKMGHLLDGISSHMDSFAEERRFRPSSLPPCDIVRELRESGAEMLINFLPVGSVEATEHYASCALEAGVAFINCIPVFIASDPKWADKFEQAGLPLIGDDIKSQLGATIIHRVLTRLCEERGIRINRTYQLNIGGNTDFLNMLNRERVAMKKISKTEAVQSQLETPLAEEHIHVGPSDYIPWLKDNKICHIRIEGSQFGGADVKLDVKLSVEDSPNSAGIVIDVIRCCKLALERRLSGSILPVAAYAMKHPLVQCTEEEARVLLGQFIQGAS